jgi:hypothetical protein
MLHNDFVFFDRFASGGRGQTNNETKHAAIWPYVLRIESFVGEIQWPEGKVDMNGVVDDPASRMPAPRVPSVKTASESCSQNRLPPRRA